MLKSLRATALGNTHCISLLLDYLLQGVLQEYHMRQACKNSWQALIQLLSLKRLTSVLMVEKIMCSLAFTQTKDGSTSVKGENPHKK